MSFRARQVPRRVHLSPRPPRHYGIDRRFTSSTSVAELFPGNVMKRRTLPRDVNRTRGETDPSRTRPSPFSAPFSCLRRFFRNVCRRRTKTRLLYSVVEQLSSRNLKFELTPGQKHRSPRAKPPASFLRPRELSLPSFLPSSLCPRAFLSRPRSPRRRPEEPARRNRRESDRRWLGMDERRATRAVSVRVNRRTPRKTEIRFRR